ncbi:Nodulin-like [Trypanosoma melophagium]|uniref:Nodulin-like n=1 Tax=Trypanosoma melophagium TaxID=715481 RepID=UPI00351A1EF1|nr:Nodulin-like [Trypanosoma melophagium]
MTPAQQKSHPVTVVTPIPVNPYITHINDRRRFVMLVAGIFTATGISAHYCFALISDYLKNRYHFGQADLTIISTVGTSAGAFSFPAGVVFDYLGPSAALGIPCVIGASGFLLMGLTFSSYIEGTVVLFSIFYGIIYFGASSMDTGSLMTNMLNFPRDRGAVVVLQKTFNGLGSSIMTVWFISFFFRPL